MPIKDIKNKNNNHNPYLAKELLPPVPKDQHYDRLSYRRACNGNSLYGGLFIYELNKLLDKATGTFLYDDFELGYDYIPSARYATDFYELEIAGFCINLAKEYVSILISLHPELKADPLLNRRFTETRAKLKLATEELHQSQRMLTNDKAPWSLTDATREKQQTDMKKISDKWYEIYSLLYRSAHKISWNEQRKHPIPQPNWIKLLDNKPPSALDFINRHTNLTRPHLHVAVKQAGFFTEAQRKKSVELMHSTKTQNEYQKKLKSLFAAPKVHAQELTESYPFSNLIFPCL